MASARYDTTRVDIEAGEFKLRATGSIRRFDGFERGVDRHDRQRAVEQQHLDERAGATRITELPPGTGPEALVGPHERARLPRLGEGERAWQRAGLAHQHLEVVVERQRLLALAGMAPVAGDDPALVEHLDAPGAEPDRDRPTGESRGYRVEAAAHPDAGLAVDRRGEHDGGVERLRRQRSEERLLGGECLTHRLPPSVDVSPVVRLVRHPEPRVELGEAHDLGHGHQVAPAEAADLALDAALPMGPLKARRREL